jgi:hypothetical protein
VSGIGTGVDLGGGAFSCVESELVSWRGCPLVRGIGAGVLEGLPSRAWIRNGCGPWRGVSGIGTGGDLEGGAFSCVDSELVWTLKGLAWLESALW